MIYNMLYKSLRAINMSRLKKGLPRRYAVFLIGLFVLSLGIAAITKGSLGTSPITSIPYSLSMIFTSMTLGNFTILYSLLLVAIQAALLGRKANKFNLLMQVIVSFIFGYFVDFGMWVFDALNPVEYVSKLVCVVLGCCGLAFGVYMQIVADLVIIPGDGLAYTLTMKLRKPYNRVRVSQDVTMIVIAAIIGYIGLGTLGGVREGTVISALLVGNVASLYIRKCGWLTDKLIPGRNAAIRKNTKTDTAEKAETKDTVAASQTGRGAHERGRHRVLRALQGDTQGRGQALEGARR